MLALHFARRYLFSRKSHSVINLISGVSVLAIAMPVAAMIILLSVFNGFEELIKSMASAFDADLTITAQEGSSFSPSAIDTCRLREVDGVVALSYVVEQNGLIRYRDRQQQITFRGVEENYRSIFPIEEALVSGSYQLHNGKRDALIIGNTLRHALAVRGRMEEPFTLYALKRNGFSSILPLTGYTRREADLSGVFSLDGESEERYLIASRHLVEELFAMEGRVTALLLRVEDPDRLSEVRQQVTSEVGDDFRVRTRYELRPSFYDMMTYEKWGIFFIALLVLILASFSMVGALVMLILEKRDEVGTLRAMGADTGLIRRIFISEGLLIGAFGALIGVVLGMGITLLQQHVGFVRMPGVSFLVESYPVAFRWGDLVATLSVYTVVVVSVSLFTVRHMISTQMQYETKKV